MNVGIERFFSTMFSALESLPDDSWGLIISQLDIEDLAALRASRRCRHVVDSFVPDLHECEDIYHAALWMVKHRPWSPATDAWVARVAETPFASTHHGDLLLQLARFEPDISYATLERLLDRLEEHPDGRLPPHDLDRIVLFAIKCFKTRPKYPAQDVTQRLIELIDRNRARHGFGQRWRDVRKAVLRGLAERGWWTEIIDTLGSELLRKNIYEDEYRRISMAMGVFSMLTVGLCGRVYADMSELYTTTIMEELVSAYFLAYGDVLIPSAEWALETLSDILDHPRVMELTGDGHAQFAARMRALMPL